MTEALQALQAWLYAARATDVLIAVGVLAFAMTALALTGLVLAIGNRR